MVVSAYPVDELVPPEAVWSRADFWAQPAGELPAGIGLAVEQVVALAVELERLVLGDGCNSRR